MYRVAEAAVAELRWQGDDLCVAPQNLYEFWVIATRPLDQNGLGLPPLHAQAALARLKGLFRLLDETPAVFLRWEQLVTQYQFSGKNAHDAYLVASMIVHGISRIPHFQRR